MTPSHAPRPVLVVVEFGPSVQALVGGGVRVQVAERARLGLERLVDALGLPVVPRVQVRDAATSRALRVRVDGRAQRYDPALLRRACVAAAPFGVRSPADLARGDGRAPDGWVPDVLRAWGTASDDAAAFLAAAAVEVVRRRASSLLTPPVVAAYAAAPTAFPVARAAVDEPALARVLAVLVDRGIAPRPRERVLAWVVALRALGASVADVAEIVADRLRTRTLTVRLHPVYLRALADTFDELVPPSAAHADGAASDPLDATPWAAAVRASAQAGSGFPVPGLAIVPDDDVAFGFAQATVNDVALLAVAGLRPDERWAAVDPSYIMPWVDTARPITNPLTGAPAVAVPGEAGALATLGTGSWSAAHFLLMLVRADLAAYAPSLLAVVDVEVLLAQLAGSHPDLARAALRRTGALARALREWWHDDFAAGDLRGLADLIVRGEAAAARRRLRHRSGEHAAAASPLRVIAIEPDAAARLASTPALADDEAEALTDAVRAAVAREPSAVVVVPGDAAERVAVRDFLGVELPRIGVVSAAELRGLMTVTTATVGSPTSPPAS